MDGEDGAYVQEALWAMNYDCLALDTDDGIAYPGFSGEAGQPHLGGPPETWKNGSSDCGPSDCGLLFYSRKRVGVPAHFDPDQSVAKLGSTDVTQAAPPAP